MADSPVTGATPSQAFAQRRRKVVVVLGMHRSGTSAMTRILNLMGADISSNLLLGRDDNNQLGFWESQDVFLTLDEMLLEATGEAWDSSAAFPRVWLSSPRAKEYQDRLLSSLAADFERSQLFVLKDPRICRLVPFWLDIFERFDTDPYFVLPLRNPLEVAHSLKTRDGIHLSRSYLIWLRHILDSERDTRGLRRSFTTYEALLADWRAVMHRSFKELELPEPLLTLEREAEVDNYLSSRWRHHALSLEDVVAREDLVCWVKDAYQVLLAAAQGDQTQLVPTLDRVRGEFETAEIAFAPIIADQAARMKDSPEKAEQIAMRAKAAQEELITLRGQHARLETELLAQSEQLREQAQRIERLEMERAACVSELEAMKQSSSWKVTKPLRVLGRLVK
jgi:hypothetical protein